MYKLSKCSRRNNRLSSSSSNNSNKYKEEEHHVGLLRRLRLSNSIVSTQQLRLRLDIIIRMQRRRVWEGWEVLGVLEGWGEWYMEHLRGVIGLGILVHLGRLGLPVQAEEAEAQLWAPPRRHQ